MSHIYVNLPGNAIVRPSYPPRSGHSQSQETILAPSTDKQTRNYDTECSNYWSRARTTQKIVIPLQYLKFVFAIHFSTLSLAVARFLFNCDGSIWDFGGKFRLKVINLFWTFWNLLFDFFFKRGNHEEHHNQNVDNLVHCIIAFNTQDLDTCFADIGILVWHWFSLGILKPSLLQLI